MTFACGRVQVVTVQIASVLYLLLARLQDQWVRRLDVVVDDVVRENTTLALRQEEQGKFLVQLALTRARLMRVVDVKHTTSQS